MPYALKVKTGEPIDAVETRIRDALSDEGFGVLTEIDVQSTLKEKLDVDRRPHRILGACNPPLADQGLQAEPDLGVLLPCNVTLYEDEEGATVVSAMKPTAALEIIGNPEIDKIAREVEERIERVLANACPGGERI